VTRQVTAAAVDLGASGGRVMVGRAGPGLLELREAHRFSNVPVSVLGTLHWDILRLYADVLDGIRAAAAGTELASIGIDSWGVDYGLVDASGALLGNPVHYRDRRTEGAVARLQTRITAEELYAVTGIQQLALNTIYQLTAAAGTPQLGAAATLLLIPDLLVYWLTGQAGAEVTNASTTGLLDVTAQTWATSLMQRAGLPPGIFPPLRQPGEVVGDLLPGPAGTAGLRAPLPVIAVGSHDTASAVAAVPAASPAFAYISSGTWSLAGLELTAPVLSEESRLANFTNEAGIDGTVRYLRNVTGLWLLQECVRCWGSAAGSLESLLLLAAAAPALRFVIDADDPVFLPPGDMPGRIVSWLSSRGLPAPSEPAEIVRCILDSLALAYRRALLAAQSLSGRHADVVHIVGGGSRNELLCQLTADALGLPVVAGPAEATALGNVLVQARSLGAAPASLDGMRALLRSSGGLSLRSYLPAGDVAVWESAARRACAG